MGGTNYSQSHLEMFELLFDPTRILSSIRLDSQTFDLFLQSEYASTRLHIILN